MLTCGVSLIKAGAECSRRMLLECQGALFSAHATLAIDQTTPKGPSYSNCITQGLPVHLCNVFAHQERGRMA
jgi:hypothetical protein